MSQAEARILFVVFFFQRLVRAGGIALSKLKSAAKKASAASATASAAAEASAKSAAGKNAKTASHNLSKAASKKTAKTAGKSRAKGRAAEAASPLLPPPPSLPPSPPPSPFLSSPASPAASRAVPVCHVVSHTHWDRAWYLPFEKFRLRLIEMVDDLLDLLASDPDFKHFFFDGQMIPLEDYLAVRPHRREALVEAIRSGKLVLGPHYILPDEFLVSGESLIRDLLIGRRLASELGKPSMVGYMPDSFGHPSQIPQILNGFGIDSFIFTRGADEKIKRLGVEFYWKGSEGESRVLAINQLHGYGNANAIGHPGGDLLFQSYSAEKACSHADWLAGSMRSRCRANAFLFNNGMDHQPAQRTLPQAIRDINRYAAGRYKLVHSTLEKFLAGVRKSSAAFKTYQGELRGGLEQNNLPGVYSARLYLKQLNQQCQMLLERHTEPLSAILAWEGYAYPLDACIHAWKTLLQCHPHDDICGCSVDEVHRDMLNRFAHVEQTGEWLRDRALDHLLFEVAMPDPSAGTPLLVFNTLPRERNEFIRSVVEAPAEDATDDKLLELVDSKGEFVPAVFALLEEPFKVDWAWGEQMRRKVRVEFVARDLPPGGYEVFLLRRKVNAPAISAPLTEQSIREVAKCLENDWVRVEAKPNGCLEIVEKRTGELLARTNIFEDAGDRGDEYDFDPIPGDTPVYTQGAGLSWAIVRRGPERVVARLEQVFHIPQALEPSRMGRTTARVEIPLRTEVSLCAHSPRMDFRVSYLNLANDHRLRIAVEVPGQMPNVWVESKFDVLKRPVNPPDETWFQPPKPTAPQEGWAALETEGRGVAIFNRGLPEYEVETCKDTMRYWLTMVRGVGWLSKGDLKTRQGNAGPEIQAPEAQCRGERRVEFSIMAYNGTYEKAGAPKTALEYLTPPVSASFTHGHRAHRGSRDLPLRHSFYSLDTNDLLISAIKGAEAGGGTIFRVWNPGTKTRKGKLTLDRPIVEARLVRLDETPLKKLSIEKDGKSVVFEAKPKQIVTLEIKPGEKTLSPARSAKGA